MSVEKIAKITELSLEEVKALAKQQLEVCKAIISDKAKISVVRYSGDFRVMSKKQQ